MAIEDDIPMKNCSRCKKDLPLSEYWPRRGDCKACHREVSRIHRLATYVKKKPYPYVYKTPRIAKWMERYNSDPEFRERKRAQTRVNYARKKKMLDSETAL